MDSAGVRIDPRARRWLTGHGGAVTLRSAPRHGCCGGTARLPVAEPGPPASADADAYRLKTVDGIHVYLAAPLAEGVQTLTVRLEGLLGWHRLFVETPDAGGQPPDDQSM
ncbi:CC/Se motif family (seleno)protein [Spiribacter roseus]|uniref:CC/Se motif family (seleno)protein n=1 Tax=Spiribacter roseus TaxID=1855875 RepID=UPI00296E6BA5